VIPGQKQGRPLRGWQGVDRGQLGTGDRPYDAKPHWMAMSLCAGRLPAIRGDMPEIRLFRNRSKAKVAAMAIRGELGWVSSVFPAKF